MIAILSGSEVKPKDAKPAESGIVPKKAVPAASPGEAPEKPAGKTGAATDPKPLEIVSDKMTLDKKTGTLSASGNVRIETAQATITAAEVEVTLKKTGAAAAAEKIILSQVDFRDATLREAVEFLAAKSKALDATGVGVNIILKEMEKAGAVEITLKLTDIPLSEALRYVAALANCELVAEEFALVIRPLPAGKVPAPNADPEKGAPNPPAAPAPAAPKSAALKKAGTIIFPKIDLRDATLSETVDFLRAKAKDLDPKGDGVNIILKPGGADAKITLSLANIPLAEALRYVAALADFEIVAEDAAIVVQPAGKK